LTSQLGKEADERCAALASALRQRLPSARFAEHLVDGIVFWRDLELETPLKLVDHLLSDEDRRELFSQTLDRTDQLKRLLGLLCKLSVRDPLTGLFNRRHFDHRLHQELQRARRDGRPCSVMLVDLDNFKTVNDSEGHDAGDQVLRCVSHVLRSSLRATDEIARIGGDEFAVVLPNTDFENAMQVVGKRLIDRTESCRQELAETGLDVSVSVSIGMTTFYAANPITPAEVLKKADEALYMAKAAGKNAIRGLATPPEKTGLTDEEREALFR
jgi:two-component system cell cycle response regulator